MDDEASDIISGFIKIKNVDKELKISESLFKDD
jgi:hypothetical protein